MKHQKHELNQRLIETFKKTNRIHRMESMENQIILLIIMSEYFHVNKNADIQ